MLSKEKLIYLHYYIPIFSAEKREKRFYPCVHILGHIPSSYIQHNLLHSEYGVEEVCTAELIKSILKIKDRFILINGVKRQETENSHQYQFLCRIAVCPSKESKLMQHNVSLGDTVSSLFMSTRAQSLLCFLHGNACIKLCDSLFVIF